MILSQGVPNIQKNLQKYANMGTSSKEPILQEQPVTPPSRKSLNLPPNTKQEFKLMQKISKLGNTEASLINILIALHLIIFISAQEQLKDYNSLNEQQVLMHNFKSPNNSRNSPKSNHEPYHRSHPRADSNFKNSEEHRQSYWQQQQNSSTVYHLHEEIRLLKLKNSHLQQHMDRMQLQYQQLRRTLEMFEQNEKQQLKRNNELINRVNNQQNRILQLKNQLELLKLQNEELKADGKTAKYRQEQLRRRIERIKTTQMNLNDKIQQLQRQNEQLKAKETEREKQTGRNKNEVNSIKKQVESLQRQLAETETTSSDKIEKIKQEFQQKQRELTTAIDKKQQQLKQLEQINRQLKLHNDNLQSQLTTMLEQVKQQSAPSGKIEELMGKHQQALKTQGQQKNKQIQNLKQKIEKILQQKQQLQQKCNSQADQTKIQDFTRVQGENKEMKQKIAEQAQRNDLLIVELTHYKALVNKHKEQSKQKIMDAELEDQLQELQKQYNQQLQALRRLVLYKKYSNPNENNVYLTSTNNSQKQEKIRQEYQKRIDVLVRDYQELQKELLSIQQEAITKHYNGAHDSITFRTSEEERDLYVQAIRKWQLAYEQQKAIYKAKITSKQEHINLLNLRITNISQVDC